MLSRTADSIFWMSRYIERAENVARFIDVNMQLAMDVGGGGPRDQWAPLVVTTGDDELYTELYGEPDQQKAIEFLTFDVRNPNSILSCLMHARENARTVREMISSAMWEELNKFYLMVRSAKSNPNVWDSAYEFFHEVKLASHLLEGITVATMSHGEAWHFARMGRLLERADKTSRILDVKYYVLLPTVDEVGTPLDTVQWSALLESASALEMYRKRFGRIMPTHVADFLILDREFPRAMHFCLIKAEDSLLAITGVQKGHFHSTAEKRLGRLRSQLDYTQIGEIIEQGMHEFIDAFQVQLNLVGEAIHETFFAMRPVGQSQAAFQQ
ncbi:MAG: alpha-E domain-containing protein [Planctomycetota bacterium]|nr:MAG: alpha-E domain-containing protein [Planctomycetota bacterium]